MKRKIIIVVDQSDEKTSFKGMVFQNGELIGKVIYENQSSPSKFGTGSPVSKILSEIFKSKKP